MAARLGSTEGVAIGELFSYLSALYFRGKLAYARAFSGPPARRGSRRRGRTSQEDPDAGVLVITPCQGLRPASARLKLGDLSDYASVRVDPAEARYRAPLEATLLELVEDLGPRQPVVLLGSVASPKYVPILTAALGSRLMFPAAFVGRGDMSRGGLLLRQTAAGKELDYVSVLGTPLHGTRPPRLERPVTSRTRR